MNKIIKIDGDKILIGTENGSIIEANRKDCDGFMPSVGEEVLIYKSENTIVINKADTRPTVQGEHVVDKLTYGILAIFLGGIGVHRFYAGYLGLGIIYLIFFWTCIPAIIGLIEGIIALCKESDKNGKIAV